LRSATSINARVIGRGGQIGEIKPEYAADFLVVKGDPTQDITTIENIACVVRGGTRLDPISARDIATLETSDAVTTDLTAYVEFLERQTRN
jgi:hypothetical protein